jgi:hypothetical protein
VAVRDILSLFAELDGAEFSFDSWARDYARHSVLAPLDFHEQRPSLCICRYEDMVEGRLGGLEEYLGLKLEAGTAVSPEHGRVARTRTYGGWRNWFTDEDVEDLRPVLQPYLQHYYAGAEWDLSAEPSVSAEFSSAYVARIVNERRAAEHIPLFGG